jgi:voltage-gated potassium channel
MEETRPKRLREDPPAREELREKLDRYLDVPLALVLLAVIELTGDARSSRLGSLGTILRQAR